MPDELRYRRFVTVDAGPAERFEHWAGWLSEALAMPVRLEPPVPVPSDFSATGEVLGVGDVTIVELRCGPVVGSWRREHAERSGLLRVLVFHRAPNVRVRWHGNAAEVVDGGAAIIGRTDGWWSAPAGMHAVQLNVPRCTVPLPDGVLARVASAQLPRDCRVFELFVRPVLAGMVGRLREVAETATAELATACQAMVTMLVRSLADDGGAGLDALAARRRRVRRYIQANLDDPRLGPDRIAAALCISRRGLYHLMSADGEGIASTIRRQRLRRAYLLLRDPIRRHSTVAEIAEDVGLRSAAHFSRLFRAEYGLTPRQVRALPQPTDRGRR